MSIHSFWTNVTKGENRFRRVLSAFAGRVTVGAEGVFPGKGPVSEYFVKSPLTREKMVGLLIPIYAEIHGYDRDSSNISCSTRRINSRSSANTAFRASILNVLLLRKWLLVSETGKGGERRFKWNASSAPVQVAKQINTPPDSLCCELVLSTGTSGWKVNWNGLASKAQNVLKGDPFSGHLFIFREHDLLVWCVKKSRSWK